MFKKIKTFISKYFTFILFYFLFISSSFFIGLGVKQHEINKQKQILKILNKNQKELKNKLKICEKFIKKNELNKEIIFKLVKPYIASNVPYSIVKETIKETINYYYPDPLFINSIIIVESNYNIMAISKKGSVGCMQINYKVWKKELVKNGIIKEYRDLFDPHICVKAGIYVLMKYYNQTGNWEKTLYLYVGKSKKYVDKVFKIYGILNMKLKENNIKN